MPEKRKEIKGNLDDLMKDELLLWKREKMVVQRVSQIISAV